MRIGDYEIIEQLGDTAKIIVGAKVRFIGVSDEQVRWGSNDDPRKYLNNNDIYTIAKVEVHSFHTKIYLEEFPDKKFNSVSFEIVNEQEINNQ